MYATSCSGLGPGITATSSQPSSPQLSRICLVACTSRGTVTYSHLLIGSQGRSSPQAGSPTPSRFTGELASRQPTAAGCPAVTHAARRFQRLGADQPRPSWRPVKEQAPEKGAPGGSAASGPARERLLAGRGRGLFGYAASLVPD